MSTPSMDPYEVLGVSKEAQIAEIRSAHRKLVLKCHPDKVQDPELKAKKQDEFQKVQQAYEILSDEKERQRYDDKIRLAELRQQFQNNPNSSAARSSPKVYEVRTVDPSSRPYKTAPPPPAAGVKISASYSRSWDDSRSGPRYYEADIRIPRREQTYHDKPSKRESEKEREKERERDKRRARKEREAAEERRAEKAAKKEAARAKEKQRSKDHKREKDEKRRERDAAYIEPFDDDEIPMPRRSGKKYEERRDRSRDETPPRDRDQEDFSYAREYARAYIHRSRTDVGPDRSPMYHLRNQPPAAPSPPPSVLSAYPPPSEDEVRRSQAKPRRGSADVPPTMPKERSYHRSSREPLDEAHEPNIVNVSPAARSARRFAGGPPGPDMAGSPPRVGISRTHTMPTELPTRPMPAPRRAQTYTEHPYGTSPEYAGNRGRHRSKNMPQVPAESSDSEEEYERQRRPKHRSSRKTRSPEPSGGAEIRYQVDGGRTKLHSYSRRLDPEPSYYYEAPQRPAYPRETSYVSSSYPRVKMSKTYGSADIQYSHYGAPHYQEEMPAARA